jgi:hypothetical protein
VVGVTAVVAFVLGPAMLLVLTVVVKLCEPVRHKCQILIPEALHLLLCDRK